MDLLYVGDNRNRENWGCRGTSISLYGVLAEEFSIGGVVDGEYAAGETPIRSKLLSPEWFRKITRRRDRHPVFGYYVAAEELLGAETDFVSEDPRRSARTIYDRREENGRLGELYDAVADSDGVVINGEGDMIFTTPPRRKLLFLLSVVELADALGKPVYYLNAMISDCPVDGRNQRTAAQAARTLRKCNAVTLRDPRSLELLEELAPEAEGYFVPDALFSWHDRYAGDLSRQLPDDADFIVPFPEEEEYLNGFDLSAPYVCVGGSSLAQREPERAIPAYEGLVRELREGLDREVLLVQTSPSDRFLEEVADRTETPILPVETPVLAAGGVLANADALVSGRYHPSIFASLGGTRCVFLGSNSHKTRSLQEVLGYEDRREFGGFPSADERREIVAATEDAIEKSGDPALRETVEERAAEVRELPGIVADHWG
ncbi:polysaccharide pyruvyl transferase family protein [Saliphagus infecundisoli]|uniref:Polysaccharide pyruvyl transferase family protein n=1 Tax=Saliphagus infecundisoli TaxID=1849069 RepID=A0ABD5QKX3_9EURY|nr:polysaccharide pyruvyl transferase family protein [Saliphagus infecundisoli]